MDGKNNTYIKEEQRRQFLGGSRIWYKVSPLNFLLNGDVHIILNLEFGENLSFSIEESRGLFIRSWNSEM